MKSSIYAQCGLRLRSELVLDLPAVSGDDWDVDVVLSGDMGDSRELPAGEVIAAYGSPEERWYTVTATATGYCIRFRECGEFLISADLTEVQVRRDAAASHANLLPIVMAGTVSALLLALGGATVLHASAVAINGTALGFVGPSGRGKSTIAALMCVNGAKLVTDDLLTVDAGRPVMCVGAARELRLRPNAAALVEQHPDAITRQTVDERLALTVESAPLEPLPLAAIVIPGPSRTANKVDVQQLSPRDALLRFLAFPRVYGWRQPGVLTRDFATLSHLVNAVPVYEAVIPWGPPFGPSVVRVLSALAVGQDDIGNRSQ